MGNNMEEKNPFEPQNPYIALEARFLMIEIALKAANANLECWRNEFNAVFIPDQTMFDDLRLQAKTAQRENKPITHLDAIYLKMAMIYKKWLPLKDRLYATNPVYRPLFAGLQKILDDIESKQNKAASERSEQEIKDVVIKKRAKTSVHKKDKKNINRTRTKRDTV